MVSTLCLVLVCGFFTVPSSAQESASYERIKAAFVYNFLKFVQWPKEAFENKKSPIVLGVFMNEGFSCILKTVVQAKTIDGRSIKVIESDDVRDLLACQLVYFDKRNEDDMSSAVNAFEEGHTLTVGDAGSFCDRGGIIRLYQEKKKVRFEVNLQAARRKNLKVSSKLLGLATIVRDT